MTAKDEILEKIAAGFNNSRKLADELHYNQEYIRRVISKLAGDGLIEIIKEPRGHTYVINEMPEVVWNAALGKHRDLADARMRRSNSHDSRNSTY